MILCWKIKKSGALSLDEPVTDIKNIWIKIPNYIINSIKKNENNVLSNLTNIFDRRESILKFLGKKFLS